MEMRQRWVGLIGIVGVSLLFGCGVRQGDPTFKETPIPRMTVATCRPLGPPRTQDARTEIPAGQSRLVYLPGEGRDHSLLIWADHSTDRVVTLRELGNETGVHVTLSPAPADRTLPWGVVTLDARECQSERPPVVVKRHDDGSLSEPGGSYDARRASAVAVLRGNSGYMLATPTRE